MTRLEPRGDRQAPLVFKQGAHPPYAIRWYGATSLLGPLPQPRRERHRERVDRLARLDATARRRRRCSRASCGCSASQNRGTLLESLERPLWIDFVADTGDDRDVSQAVGRMVFDEYTVDDGGVPITLPRGDVLLFGGDTAYPVAHGRGDLRDACCSRGTRCSARTLDPRRTPRVLLGIPGNHDWYDGLDGFGRFFRRSCDAPEADERSPRRAPQSVRKPAARPQRRPRRAHAPPRRARRHRADRRRTSWQARARFGAARASGARERLAPRTATSRAGVELLGAAARAGAGPLGRRPAARRPRLPAARATSGAPADGRRRERRRLVRRARSRASPSASRGSSESGCSRACRLSLERDRVLFQCGDMHQYERRVLANDRCTSSREAEALSSTARAS